MTPEPSEPFEGVDPESLAPADVTSAEIRSALESPDPVVRQRGARVCTALAAQDAETVRPHVGDLLDRLDDDSLAVTRHAATALVLLSDTAPGDFEGSLAPVVDLAGHDLGGIQTYAAKILANVAVAAPDACAPHVGEILAPVLGSEGTYSAYESDVEGLEGLSQGVPEAIRRLDMEESQRRVAARATLAHVVVAVAEERPGAVVDHLADVRALLDDEDPGVVGAGVDAFAAVAGADPEAVAPFRDDLVACLDHDDQVVRARAVKALGFAGDDAVVGRLRTVAENDDDPGVRELAAETADFLDG